MTTSVSDELRWTSADLELLPENGNRYEIIDGELFVTKAPRFEHQNAAFNISLILNSWSKPLRLGYVVITPGLIFSENDNVIPDVIWISKERFNILLNETGHFNGAPELVVEVLSPGVENEQRDKQVKLKLYSRQGVQEYWIIDPKLQQMQVYQRQQAKLVLQATLLKTDELTSPLFPNCSGLVADIFEL